MSILRWLTAETVSAALAANAVASVQAQTALTPLAAGASMKIAAASGLITVDAGDLTVQAQTDFALGLNLFDSAGGFVGFCAFAAVPLMNPTGGNQRPVSGANVVYAGDIELNFSNSQLPPGAAQFALAASITVKNGATAGRHVTIDITALVYY